MPEHVIFDKSSAVGFIGAGRLGSSMAVAMRRAGYAVTAVSSRRHEQRAWLQERLPDALVTDRPQAVADAATIIFITTPDGAIEATAASVNWRPGQAVVHCSGAVPLDALRSAEGARAFTGGIHPAQTFPSRDAAESFRGIPFGIEAAEPHLESWLDRLAQDLGGSPVFINAGMRSAYHASVVMACGLIAGMTGLAAEVWASTGALNRGEAVRSLSPIVSSTARWIGEKGLPAAMTGPYVRGDEETVARHIEAVSAVSPEIGAAYAAVALASLGIAREQGGLDEKTYQNIKSNLLTALRRNCDIIK
jgi:predicted short-subunit dehydrogenase-like oxidoreductase (DUF2520 family)